MCVLCIVCVAPPSVMEVSCVSDVSGLSRSSPWATRSVVASPLAPLPSTTTPDDPPPLTLGLPRSLLVVVAVRRLCMYAMSSGIVRLMCGRCGGFSVEFAIVGGFMTLLGCFWGLGCLRIWICV